MVQEQLLKKIDQAAIMWNKTKDPKYKDLWYKYIKDYVNGINYTNRRNISTSPSNKSNVERYDDSSQGRLF